jgi:transcriptional regulator with XRE-family HTH domain
VVKTSTLNMRVLEHLNREIARLGVTQTQIEAKTGIPQSEVGKILRGERRKPSLDVLDALARCVGRTLADLLHEQLPPVKWSEDVLMAALALEALKPTDPARIGAVELAKKGAKGRLARTS